jgi:hypothetical protein
MAKMVTNIVISLNNFPNFLRKDDAEALASISGKTIHFLIATGLLGAGKSLRPFYPNIPCF